MCCCLDASACLLVAFPSTAGLQITPFRFVGSTAMMKRLRTVSSPFLQPLDGCQPNPDTYAGPAGTLGTGAIDKLKAKGNLLPLLAIPAEPGVGPFLINRSGCWMFHRVINGYNHSHVPQIGRFLAKGCWSMF